MWLIMGVLWLQHPYFDVGVVVRDYCFYLGAVRINVFSEFPLFLAGKDTEFEKPVFPVEKEFQIRVGGVDNLPTIPAGAADFDRFLSWNSDGKECRMYFFPETGEYFAFGERRGNGVEVLVRGDYIGRMPAYFRIWSYIHLEELLLEDGALVLHSASITYKKKAILFTAPSGTGKSTQANLWGECCDDVGNINGDRNLLQFVRGCWQACGFPTSGSSVYCEQAAAPIGAVVVLRQSDVNRVIELKKSEKVLYLYSEVTVFSMNAQNVEKSLSIVESICDNVEVVMLECTPDRRAVDTLRDYLYGE